MSKTGYIIAILSGIGAAVTWFLRLLFKPKPPIPDYPTAEDVKKMTDEEVPKDFEKRMKRVRKKLSVILVACMTGSAVYAVDPVKDCPQGLKCYTIAQIREFDITLALAEKKIDDLTHALKVEKDRSRRLFGPAFGCGPGYGIAALPDDVGAGPLLSCNLIYGLRFRSRR